MRLDVSGLDALPRRSSTLGTILSAQMLATVRQPERIVRDE